MSPIEQAIADYFEALAAHDYRTARACLIDVVQGSSNPKVVEDLIRRTHEMEA